MSLHKNRIVSVLISSLIPIVIGIVSIKIIVKNLGTENFGIFTLAITLLGFAGSLDLGMSRLLSVHTSKLIQLKSEKEQLSQNFSYALTLVCVVSVIIILLSVITLDTLGPWFFDGDIEKYNKLRISIIWILSSMPFLALTGTIRGGFEGLGDFQWANRILIFSSTLNFIVPLVCSFFTKEISIAFTYLFFFRAIFCFILFRKLSQLIPLKIYFRRRHVLGAESFWITLNSILSPLMLYSDRFIMSSHFTLSQIAYYCTPIDLALRTLIIPQSITRVMLPSFAKNTFNYDSLKIEIDKFLEIMTFLCLPVLLVLAGFSFDILKIWVGLEIANQSHYFLSIGSMGLFFNCLTWITFNIQQSFGEYKSQTYLQLVTSIIYISLVVTNYKRGLEFLTWLWALRFIFDFFILSFFLGYNHRPLLKFVEHLFRSFVVYVIIWIPVILLDVSLDEKRIYTCFILSAILFIKKNKILNYVKSLSRDYSNVRERTKS